MKKYLYTLSMLHVFSCIALSQQFTYHSNSPFGIDPLRNDTIPINQRIQFYDLDGDGDLDVFFTGLDSIDNVSNLKWENVHFFIEMQENIGTKYAPQFGDRQPVSAFFPYPVGYFFAAPGDVNQDGLTDFMTAAHIDFIGNQKLRLLSNTGLPGIDQFEITTLESMGLTDFVPESFFMPHLVDLDLDGDLDLMVSGFVSAFAEEDGPDDSAIFYARNIGTKDVPNFQGWYVNPYGLKPDTIPEFLTSGDIDLDGDVDFISALMAIPADSINAILVHLNNPGVDQKPAFSDVLKSPFGMPLFTGSEQVMSPYLADMDGDGDLDLFVFRGNAVINVLEYYENELCVVNTQEVQLSICEGESLKYNGATLTQAGIYEFHITNDQQCDSIVLLELIVNALVTGSVEATICEGESYVIGNDVFTQAGDYMVFVTAANGCDSIINLTLTVDPAATSTVEATICEGDAYTIGGEVFVVPGNYSVIITAANGCDSIIDLTLTVDPIANASVQASICEGESYTIGNDVFVVAGQYTVTVTAANGCDSIVSLNLQVNDVNADILLAGETLTASAFGATYQWIDCDSGQDIPGAVSQSYEVTITGNYAVVVTSPEGCSEQSECVNVIVTSVKGAVDSQLISFYPNPAKDVIYILNPENYLVSDIAITNVMGQVVLETSVDDDMKIDVSGLHPGAYIVRYSGTGINGVVRVIIN